MGRRTILALVLLTALEGCVRVRGVAYQPARRPPASAPSISAAWERTRALKADLAAWEAVHPALAGMFALASSRTSSAVIPVGRVHIVGAVEANVADVPEGGAPLGELLYGAARPTWEADLTRIAVIDGDQVWLVDWWNLPESGLRSCPFRVGGGSLVVVFSARGHEAALRYRFWDTLARGKGADATDRARAAAASLCKPIE